MSSDLGGTALHRSGCQQPEDHWPVRLPILSGAESLPGTDAQSTGTAKTSEFSILTSFHCSILTTAKPCQSLTDGTVLREADSEEIRKSRKDSNRGRLGNRKGAEPIKKERLATLSGAAVVEVLHAGFKPQVYSRIKINQTPYRTLPVSGCPLRSAVMRLSNNANSTGYICLLPHHTPVKTNYNAPVRIFSLKVFMVKTSPQKRRASPCLFSPAKGMNDPSSLSPGIPAGTGRPFARHNGHRRQEVSGTEFDLS